MTADSAGAPGFVVEATRELDAPPAVAWRAWTDPAVEMSRQGLEQSLDKLTPLFVDGEVAR